MAFLDLEIGAPVPLSRTVQGAAHDARLSPQERKVVLLARTDPVSSLHRSPLNRLASLLFGIETPHMLADARLEALRRYAILYRVHGEKLASAEIEAARTAGFSEGELHKTRALIDAALGRRTRGHGPAFFLAAAFGLAMAALLALGAAHAVARTIDSPLVAATLIALAVVSLAPLVGRESSSGRKTYR